MYINPLVFPAIYLLHATSPGRSSGSNASLIPLELITVPECGAAGSADWCCSTSSLVLVPGWPCLGDHVFQEMHRHAYFCMKICIHATPCKTYMLLWLYWSFTHDVRWKITACGQVLSEAWVKYITNGDLTKGHAPSPGCWCKMQWCVTELLLYLSLSSCVKTCSMSEKLSNCFFLRWVWAMASRRPTSSSGCSLTE